jgi:2-keto-4-pentenoate hydratase
MKAPSITSARIAWVVLAAVVGCSRQAPPSQDATRASQAAIRSEVEQMADDFLARRPMQGFLHDMPLTAAYYWQDVFVDRAARELGPVIGYKTGGHDPGPGFPIFPLDGIRGAILEGMLRPSGASVSLDETRRGFLEADLAVRVGDASINTASTDLELLAAIDAVIPFAEIPDPYYEEGTRSINGTIAANMGSRYSFAGEPVPTRATADWLRRLDTLTFAVHDEHGTEIDRGSIEGWYRPIEVIRWLRDDLVQGGKRLRPGDILSLGNIGIIRQLHEGSPRGPAYTGDEFTLSYYGLAEEPASVTIRIVRD